MTLINNIMNNSEEDPLLSKTESGDSAKNKKEKTKKKENKANKK